MLMGWMRRLAIFERWKNKHSSSVNIVHVYTVMSTFSVVRPGATNGRKLRLAVEPPNFKAKGGGLLRGTSWTEDLRL